MVRNAMQRMLGHSPTSHQQASDQFWILDKDVRTSFLGRFSCAFIMQQKMYKSYPLTQHDFWSGVGCFAYNTFHIW
jgi:hypothetical protein